MNKLLVKTGILFFIIGLGIFSYLLFTGPRMRTQIAIKPFQAQMPLMPKGTVPVIDAYPSINVNQKSPLLANAENIARGKVYYGYYCAFCHGASGAGDGPVGYSYVPVPSDLQTAKLKSLSDGRLRESMITGTGHAPVLTYVVPPEHQWFIVTYIRTLAANKTKNE